MDGVGVGQQVREQRMARLVVGHDALLLCAQHQRCPLEAEQHAVECRLQVGLLDLDTSPPHGDQGRFVHQVLQIGPAHARRPLGDRLEVGVDRHPLALAVHPQNGQALLQGRQWHHDLAVEASGPEQCRIEDIGAIGGGHDDDALRRLEAVHLREDLVERLLALVVATSQTRAALPADGVDLVDENDGGFVLTRRLEEVTDPRRCRPRRTSP